jgi:hypothetical protein
MCKGLHGWRDYERGVEALSKIVASENNRESSSRKALSFPDLLIKARTISLRCRYQLTSDISANPTSVQVSIAVR